MQKHGETTLPFLPLGGRCAGRTEQAQHALPDKRLVLRKAKCGVKAKRLERLPQGAPLREAVRQMEQRLDAD